MKDVDLNSKEVNKILGKIVIKSHIKSVLLVSSIVLIGYIIETNIKTNRLINNIEVVE